MRQLIAAERLSTHAKAIVPTTLHHSAGIAGHHHNGTALVVLNFVAYRKIHTALSLLPLIKRIQV